MANKGHQNFQLIGNPHLRFQEVDSTNNFANNLASKSNPSEGTAISAAFQTQGRGQIGRFWESSLGKNILTSIIFKPSFLPINRQFEFTIFISVAIWRFISSKLKNPEICSIKWPNDIYIGNKKIAGILIQNALQGNKIKYTIAGVGININQIDFSGDIPNPTSLKIECQKEFDVEKLLEELFLVLDDEYDRFMQNSRIHESIYLRNLYRINQKSKFRIEDKIVEGIIRGVNDEGNLMIEHENGLAKYVFRQIQYVI